MAMYCLSASPVAVNWITGTRAACTRSLSGLLPPPKHHQASYCFSFVNVTVNPSWILGEDEKLCPKAHVTSSVTALPVLEESQSRRLGRPLQEWGDTVCRNGVISNRHSFLRV